MEEKGSPNNQGAADLHLPDDLIVEILARLPAGAGASPGHGAPSSPTPPTAPGSPKPSPASSSSPARTPPPPLRPGILSPPSSTSLPPQQVDTALSFLPTSHGEIEMLDSCNGLLLLRCFGRSGDPFYVVCCNPATGEWVSLPQPSHAPGQKVDPEGYGIMTSSAALGFDPAVSSYFYVFQFLEEVIIHDLVVREVEIYSSETGAWVSRQSGWNQLVFLSGHKTYFKGFLYLTSSFRETIAAVDTKGQTWRVTDVQDPRRNIICDFVGHSQGRLLYVLKDWSCESLSSIRVLEDHANEESTVNHSVITMDSLGARKTEEGGTQLQTIAFHPDGNLIFFYDRPSDRFMCYDMNRKDVRVVCTVGGGAKRCYHQFFPYIPFYSRVLVTPN